MTGDELDVTVLNDLTNKMCFYDHGPALSLVELESFCSQLCVNISELKNDHNEIFSHMICIISSMQEDDYVIKDGCLMILKPPYCVLLKFGVPKTCRYLIHIHNHVLYQLGAEKCRPVPYKPQSYESYRGIYEGLKEDMINAEEERIKRDFSGFKKALKQEQYEYAKETKENTENTTKYTKALNVLVENINKAQDELTQEEEAVREKVASLNVKMLKGTKFRETSRTLELPELTRDNK